MPDLEVVDPRDGRKYTVEWLSQDAPTAADLEAIIAEGRRRSAPKEVQHARKVQAKAANPLLGAFAKPKPAPGYKPKDSIEALFGPPQPQVGDRPEVAKRHKAWQKEQLRKFDEPVRRGVAQIPSTQAEWDPFGRNEVYSEKMHGPAVAQNVLGGGKSAYHGLSMIQEGLGSAAGAAINAPPRSPLSTMLGDLLTGTVQSTIKGMTPQASPEEQDAALLNVLLTLGVPGLGKALGTMASSGTRAAGKLDDVLAKAHPGAGDARLVGRHASESVSRALKSLEGFDDSLVGVGGKPETFALRDVSKSRPTKIGKSPIKKPVSKEPWEMTRAERDAEIEAIKANREIMSSPLMKAGTSYPDDTAFPTLERTEELREGLGVSTEKNPRTVGAMHGSGEELLSKRHPVDIANEVSLKRSANDAEQAALAIATKQYQSDLRKLRGEHSAALNSGSDELKAAIPGLQAQIERMESEAVTILKAQADVAGSEVGRSLGLRAHLMPDTSSPQAARAWIESQSGMAVKDMPEPMRVQAEDVIRRASELEDAAREMGIFSADDLRARLESIPKKARSGGPRGGTLEAIAKAPKTGSALKKHISDVDRLIKRLEKEVAPGVGKSKKRGAASVIGPKDLELAALRIYRGLLSGIDNLAEVAKSMGLDERAARKAAQIAKSLEDGTYVDLTANVPNRRKADVKDALDKLDGYKTSAENLADHDPEAIEAASKVVAGHLLAGERDAEALANVVRAHLHGIGDGGANAVVRMGVDDAFPKTAKPAKRPNLSDVRTTTEKIAGGSKDLSAREYRLEVENLKRTQKRLVEQAKRDAKRAAMSGIAKAVGGFSEVMNAVPRAFQASADVSAFGRQGGKLIFKHPVIAAKNFVRSFPALWSEGSYTGIEKAVQKSPRYFKALDAGLELTGAGHFVAVPGEELFASRIAHKIPLLGHVVKGSDRAYTSFLDGLRMDVFESVADNMEQAWSVVRDKAHPRYSPMTDAQAEVLANFVNVATGRGDLGELKKVAGSLSTLFYSPRFAASNIEYLAGYPLWHGTKAKDGGTIAARAVVLKEMSQNAAAIAGLSYLASLAGAKVTLDPTSSDFGKWRFGDTTIDVSGGTGSYITFAARMLKKAVEAQQGKPAGYKSDVWLSIADFARRKAAPSISALVEGASGEEMFTGDKTNLVREFAGLFNPSSLGVRNILEQQEIEAQLWNKEGRFEPTLKTNRPMSLEDRASKIPITLLDMLGFGTNRYTPKSAKPRAKDNDFSKALEALLK